MLQKNVNNRLGKKLPTCATKSLPSEGHPILVQEILGAWCLFQQKELDIQREGRRTTLMVGKFMEGTNANQDQFFNAVSDRAGRKKKKMCPSLLVRLGKYLLPIGKKAFCFQMLSQIFIS